MGFVTLRLAASALGQRYRSAGPGFREGTETVVLEPRPGVAPSDKPPVRIFLGTEPAQYRAERVFVWSIEQVRDPARTYEIHLMKNLAGFDRRLWLTGFTNYRFAIPHLAGKAGRAIYNDVDQIYLVDPAEMFDLDMDGHGFLSISDADTSVMLIDCARMAEVWPLDAVKRERRKTLERRARTIPSLWGRLAPEWNARDAEYEAGHTACLHFTTLHTQPWAPFPREYVYRPSPVAHVWHALERSADAARYLTFDALAPTAAYRALLERIATSAPQANASVGRGALLVYGFGARTSDGGRAFDPAVADYPVPEPADRVIGLAGTLEHLPEEDVLWTADLLFRSAREAVEIRVSERPADLSGIPVVERRPADWWHERVTTIAAWYPALRWKLIVEANGREMAYQGGRLWNDLPKVWVLASEKAGHTSQSVGLAEALGWPYEVKDVRLAATDYVRPDTPDRLLSRLGLAGRDPSWPDVVIGSGWLAARVARLIRHRSGRRTRIVVLGRKSGPVRDTGEVAVALAHFGLPPNPRRIDAVLPPNQVTPERLAAAAARWPDLLADRTHPRIVLLVGGRSKFYDLDPASADRMAREVLDWTATTGGSLTIVTSRRTGEAAAKAIADAAGDAARLHLWRPEDPANPYLAFLSEADILVVTGESESMLAEAVTARKPVYIYPLPPHAPGPWQRFQAWVANKAGTAHINDRGTPRPQQGLEYLCARLIERGLVLPPRDIDAMHANVVALGVARMFGEPYQRWNRPPVDPTRDTAAQVCTLLSTTRPRSPVDSRLESAVAGV